MIIRRYMKYKTFRFFSLNWFYIHVTYTRCTEHLKIPFFFRILLYQGYNDEVKTNCHIGLKCILVLTSFILFQTFKLTCWNRFRCRVSTAGGLKRSTCLLALVYIVSRLTANTIWYIYDWKQFKHDDLLLDTYTTKIP